LRPRAKHGVLKADNEISEKVYEKFILKIAVSQKTLVAVAELVEAFLLSLFLR
jgi:hypothetical protein